MSRSWVIIALSSRRTQSQLAKEKPDSGAGEMLSGQEHWLLLQRTELASQHTYGGSQFPITPVLGALMLSLSFMGTRHVCDTHIYM